MDVIYLDFKPSIRFLIRGACSKSRLMEYVTMWRIGLESGYMIVNRQLCRMVKTLDYKTLYQVSPQGSVLGPTLFLMFVNDIDAVISSHFQKFADDCKVYRSVLTTQHIDTLQQDIDNLCKWSRDWQMLFNVKKCKVLHIGHNNAYHNYSMNGEDLQTVSEETDLGIIISSDIKPSKQCICAVKKANMVWND